VRARAPPVSPGSYLLGELLPLGRAVDDLDGQHGSRRGGRLALARFSSGGHRAESRAEVPGLERRRRFVNSTARATGALARHARLMSSLGDRGARGRAVRAREWRRRVARASRREKNKRLVGKKLPRRQSRERFPKKGGGDARSFSRLFLRTLETDIDRQTVCKKYTGGRRESIQSSLSRGLRLESRSRRTPTAYSRSRWRSPPRKW
jgi:hypothetical protein